MVKMVVVMIHMMVVVMMMVIRKIFVSPMVVMAVVLLRLGATTTDDAHPAVGAQNTGRTFLAIGRTRFTYVIVAGVPILVLFFHPGIVRLVVVVARTCRSVAVAGLAANHFRSTLILFRG